ncbi:hypothetical protein, partial [Streptomyces sp. ID01-9D]|uniref:hypothetical protein n=1 Tax=Streptomyces sp. ID01-9D TaxID=3028659 RepID=UPI0029CA094B
ASLSRVSGGAAEEVNDLNSKGVLAVGVAGPVGVGVVWVCGFWMGVRVGCGGAVPRGVAQ